MGIYDGGNADFSNATGFDVNSYHPEDETGFLGSIPDAVGTGLQKIGQTALMAGSLIPTVWIDPIIGASHGQSYTGAQDWWFENIVQPSVDSVAGTDAKARTTAGRIMYGVGSVLTELGAGGAPGLAVTEFTGRSLSEVNQGTPLLESEVLGLNQAAFAYAGAVAPAAIGGTLAARAASGATINVGLGAAQRGIEGSILDGNSDPRAQNVSALDPEGMAIDAILGAAFGGASHLYAREAADSHRGQQPEQHARVVPDHLIDAAMAAEKARFEDAQVATRDPVAVERADLGLTEYARSLDSGEPGFARPIPKESVSPDDAVVPSLHVDDGQTRAAEAPIAAEKPATKSMDWKGVRDRVMVRLRQEYKQQVTIPAGNGDEIIVAYSGLKHALHNGVPSLQETALAVHIQDAIRLSTLRETLPDRKGRKDPYSMSLYSVSVDFDGVTHDATIYVRNHLDGRRYYDHAAVETGSRPGRPERSTAPESDAISPAPPSSRLSISLDETLRDVNPDRQDAETTVRAAATDPAARDDIPPKFAPEDIPSPADQPARSLPGEHAAIAAQADAAKAEVPDWARDLAESDSQEVAEAERQIERVKAVGEVMGCVLTSGVDGV